MSCGGDVVDMEIPQYSTFEIIEPPDIFKKREYEYAVGIRNPRWNYMWNVSANAKVKGSFSNHNLFVTATTNTPFTIYLVVRDEAGKLMANTNKTISVRP